MKFVGILIVLFEVAVCSPTVHKRDKEVRGVIEDTIKKLINEIVQTLPDPLEIEETTLQIPPNDIINGQIEIQQVTATGLSSLEITNIKFSTLKLTLDISVLYKEVTAIAKVKDCLSVLTLEVNDNPSANINIKGVRLDLSVKVSLGSPIQVKSLSFLPGVDSLDIKIEGLNNDDQLSQQISDTLSNDGANWVNENAKDIDNILSPIIVAVINKVLGGTYRKAFENVFNVMRH